MTYKTIKNCKEAYNEIVNNLYKLNNFDEAVLFSDGYWRLGKDERQLVLLVARYDVFQIESEKEEFMDRGSFADMSSDYFGGPTL